MIFGCGLLSRFAVKGYMVLLRLEKVEKVLFGRKLFVGLGLGVILGKYSPKVWKTNELIWR